MFATSHAMLRGTCRAAHAVMKLCNLFVFSLVTLTACTVDDEAIDDTEDGIEVDDSIDLPGDLEGWSTLEVDGLPSGSVVIKELAEPLAAAAPFPCRAQFACLYGGRNGSGVVVGVRSGFGLPDLRQLAFNDKASSWRNRAGRRYCWYRDIGFDGPAHGMPAGRQANITGAPDNEASSYKPCN